MLKKLTAMGIVCALTVLVFCAIHKCPEPDYSEHENEISSLETKVASLLQEKNTFIDAVIDAEERCDELQDTIKELGNDILDFETELEDAESYIEELQTLSSKYKIGRFKTTAYSPYDNVSGIENNGNPNSTATGTKPTDGTMAVDPSVIPYGSKIIVLYDNGKIEHGRAEDCGGAIKGNRVDVFRWTYKEAVNHGIREATVIWYKD